MNPRKHEDFQSTTCATHHSQKVEDAVAVIFPKRQKIESERMTRGAPAMARKSQHGLECYASALYPLNALVLSVVCACSHLDVLENKAEVRLGN